MGKVAGAKIIAAHAFKSRIGVKRWLIKRSLSDSESILPKGPVSYNTIKLNDYSIKDDLSDKEEINHDMQVHEENDDINDDETNQIDQENYEFTCEEDLYSGFLTWQNMTNARFDAFRQFSVWDPLINNLKLFISSTLSIRQRYESVVDENILPFSVTTSIYFTRVMESILEFLIRMKNGDSRSVDKYAAVVCQYKYRLSPRTLKKYALQYVLNLSKERKNDQRYVCNIRFSRDNKVFQLEIIIDNALLL